MNNSATIIYDGQCSLCSGCMKWIELHAICKGNFEFIRCQSTKRKLRFPEISEEKCLESFHMVLPNGQILIGDLAIPEIVKRLKRFRRLTILFKLPVSKYIMFLLYRLVSNNRYIILQTILPLAYNNNSNKTSD